MLQICLLVSCLFGSSFKSNVYSTKVSVPLLPRQNVEILHISKNKAWICLKGVVNLHEDFTFEKDGNEWNIHWGTQMQQVLGRYRCKITNFKWENSNINLILGMPVLGRLKIRLEKK